MTVDGFPWALGPTKAIIYARSSTADKNSVEDQMNSCISHAHSIGIEVSAVFTDYGNADIANLGSIEKILEFIKAGYPIFYVVIVQDNSCLGINFTNMESFRQKFEEVGAKLLTADFLYEDSSQAYLYELIKAQTEVSFRNENRRRIQKLMRERLNCGEFIFTPPICYKYQGKSGKKILVHDNPLASIIKGVIEGFACGLYPCIPSVREFFESSPEYPRYKTETTGNKKVTAVLSIVFYAGYILSPSLGVRLTKGKHQRLISLVTFRLVQSLQATMK